MSATVVTPRPTVLIVGAGLGGVVLGALLERANIPYAIFERSSTVKPLGNVYSSLFRTKGTLDQDGKLTRSLSL